MEHDKINLNRWIERRTQKRLSIHDAKESFLQILHALQNHKKTCEDSNYFYMMRHCSFKFIGFKYFYSLYKKEMEQINPLGGQI